MRSLSYLNGQSSATVTYTDTRDANVIFDRPDPLDYTFTGTDTTFSVIVGTNIIEIVQPSQTNIRMKVNAGTTQATVSWPTIPVGCTVTQVDTVFTLSGIDSLQDWELVKSPTITLDADFFGTVNYSVEILYDTPAQPNKSVRFTVGQYVPAVEMNASASVSCAAGKIVDPELQFEAIATTSRLLAILATTAFIDSEATLEADCDKVILFNAEVDTNASIQAGITYAPALFISTINSTSSVSCAATNIQGITNLVASSYNSENISQPFASTTPQFGAFGSPEVRLTLTSPNGEFGSATSHDASYVISGSETFVNSQIANIYFWPDPGFSSNTTFNWVAEFSFDGGSTYQEYINKTISLTHAGYSGIQSITELTSTSQTITPTAVEVYYCTADFAVIGAGGGFGLTTTVNTNTEGGNSGGGGGDVKVYLNQTLQNKTYQASAIGTTSANNNGGSTIFEGITAFGGQRGYTVPGGSTNFINGIYASYGGTSGNGNSGNITANTYKDGSSGGGAGGPAPSQYDPSVRPAPVSGSEVALHDSNNPRQSNVPGPGVSFYGTTYGKGGAGIYYGYSPYVANGNITNTDYGNGAGQSSTSSISPNPTQVDYSRSHNGGQGAVIFVIHN